MFMKKIKIKLDFYLSPNHKTNSKILKIQLKGNTIKTIEEIIGQYLYDYAMKRFL